MILASIPHFKSVAHACAAAAAGWRRLTDCLMIVLLMLYFEEAALHISSAIISRGLMTLGLCALGAGGRRRSSG